MIKVLMICHGNICRSPMAEFIFKELARRAGFQDRFEVNSAAVSSEELGNPIYPPVRSIMERNSIPFGKHYAVQVKRSDYDKYDYFLIMDEHNRRGLDRIFGGDPEGKVHMLLAFSKRPRDISDPWYTRDFQQAFDDIMEGCSTFLHSFDKAE